MTSPSASRAWLATSVIASSWIALCVASCNGAARPQDSLDSENDDASTVDVSHPDARADTSTTTRDSATSGADAADAVSDADAADGAVDGAGDGSDAAMDGTSCPLPSAVCSGACTPVLTDPNNCGNCSNKCPIGSACAAGQCACPGSEVVCAGACVDQGNDPSNCGFCGHNCQGNPCLAGLCQASVIASSPNTFIKGIAVDAVNVYWTTGTTGNAVVEKAISGGSNVSFTPSPSNENDPRAIAVDHTNLYWADYGSGAIARTPILGGPIAYLHQTVPSNPVAMTVDAANVYWVTLNGDPAGNFTGTVNQASLANDNSPIIELAIEQDQPMAIAVDAKYVYWVNAGTKSSSGSVMREPIVPDALDAGNIPFPTQLATGLDQLQGIAVDATSVYFTSRGNPGAVYSVPLTGGTPKVLASGQGAPFGIAVDSQFVYWTNFNDNTVNKVAIAGGPILQLASQQNNPSAISVDALNVYWDNSGNATILKVAK